MNKLTALVFWTIVSVSFTNSSYLSKVYIRISLPRVDVRAQNSLAWRLPCHGSLQLRAFTKFCIDWTSSCHEKDKAVNVTSRGRVWDITFKSSNDYIDQKRFLCEQTYYRGTSICFWCFREETLPHDVVSDTQTPPGVPSPSPCRPESQGMCFWFRSLAACDSCRFRAWQIWKVFWCAILRLASCLWASVHMSCLCLLVFLQWDWILRNTWVTSLNSRSSVKGWRRRQNDFKGS